MAGVAFKVTVKDSEVTAAIERLVASDRTLLPPFLKNVGELLVKSTHARMNAQHGPDGTPWARLNPAYAATKRNPKILQESGQLYSSIIYQVTATSVAVGTAKVYGAIHQLGGIIVPRTADALIFRMGGRVIFARKVTIPARPYLGLSSSDRTGIVDVANDLIERVWESP